MAQQRQGGGCAHTGVPWCRRLLRFVEEERGRLDPGREGACERAGAGPCESWVPYVGSPRRGRDGLKGRGVGADAPRRGVASAVMVARGA
jgi:hypothetical protein